MELSTFVKTLEPKLKSVGFIFRERCGCGGVQQYWYSFNGKSWLCIKPKNNIWSVNATKKGKLVASGGIEAPTNNLKAALQTHYGIELDV